MTASINRNRPFVDKRGALTQYGWSVMQSIWAATGGPVAIDSDELALLLAGPAVGPIGRVSQGVSTRMEPVGLPPPVLSGVGPVNGPDAASLAAVEPVPASPAAILRRAWAVMSVQGGSSAEATTDATPRKIAAWNTDGISKGMVVDSTTGNDITAVVGGVFEIEAALSFTGTASKRLDLEIYVGGNATGFAAGRMLDAAGALGPVSIVGDVRLIAGDTVEVYHSTPDGGSAMTVVEAQLTVNRIDN